MNSVTPTFLLIWNVLFPNLQWDPPSLKEVSEDMVEQHFLPFDELEPELVLPTALREPYMWNRHPSHQCLSLARLRQISYNLFSNFIEYSISYIFVVTAEKFRSRTFILGGEGGFKLFPGFLQNVDYPICSLASVSIC